MLRKRSIFLFLVLIVLLGMTLVMTSVEEQKQSFYEDEEAFVIEDVSRIDRIIFTGKDFKNELVKNEDSWRIQDEYEVDPDVLEVLMTALKEVRVKKPVANQLASRVSEEIEENGVLVQIFDGEKEISSFWVGGDQERKESYFLKVGSQKPLVVAIPGYDQYVAHIFELKETEWRNRVIFKSNLSTLKKLKVIYPQEPSSSFEIINNDSSFVIPSLENMDTAKLMSYLELYNYVEAENYTYREKFPLFDSLLQSKPLIKIELLDENPQKNNSLTLFQTINDDQTVLGIVGEEQLAVLKYPKIRNLIKKRLDFKK